MLACSIPFAKTAETEDMGKRIWIWISENSENGFGFGFVKTDCVKMCVRVCVRARKLHRE